jgi:tetratricopeptide (TPR) repeat protein
MLGRREDFRRLSRRHTERLLEVVRSHPDDAIARGVLAVSLIREGQIEAGIAQADRAIALSPDDARIRRNAACAFARAGKVGRALQELKAAMRKLPLPGYSAWPNDPDLVGLRDHPEFIRLFQRTQKIRPGRDGRTQ